MPEHMGLPVAGYQPQSEDNVAVVNRNKEIEETIMRLCDAMKKAPEIDQRWLSIARTHFEEGFMAMNRSVFKPGRVKLPTDDGDEVELDLRTQQAETFDGKRNDDTTRIVPDTPARTSGNV